MFLTKYKISIPSWLSYPLKFLGRTSLLWLYGHLDSINGGDVIISERTLGIFPGQLVIGAYNFLLSVLLGFNEVTQSDDKNSSFVETRILTNSPTQFLYIPDDALVRQPCRATHFEKLFFQSLLPLSWINWAPLKFYIVLTWECHQEWVWTNFPLLIMGTYGYLYLQPHNDSELGIWNFCMSKKRSSISKGFLMADDWSGFVASSMAGNQTERFNAHHILFHIKKSEFEFIILLEKEKKHGWPWDAVYVGIAMPA